MPKLFWSVASLEPNEYRLQVDAVVLVMLNPVLKTFELLIRPTMFDEELTSKVYVGVAVPIPTLPVYPAAWETKVVVPEVSAPVMVADARVAVPPAPRIWLGVILSVVPP